MATIYAHLRDDCGAMRCDLGFSNCKSLNSGLCSVKMPHSGTILRIFLARALAVRLQTNLCPALRFRASAPYVLLRAWFWLAVFHTRTCSRYTR
ncbi:MAG: hypothetical protein EGQ84_06690 [Slackia sp.]|nr:hypothetical protein [Slackia sp.]